MLRLASPARTAPFATNTSARSTCNKCAPVAAIRSASAVQAAGVRPFTLDADMRGYNVRVPDAATTRTAR